MAAGPHTGEVQAQNSIWGGEKRKGEKESMYLGWGRPNHGRNQRPGKCQSQSKKAEARFSELDK